MSIGPNPNQYECTEQHHDGSDPQAVSSLLGLFLDMGSKKPPHEQDDSHSVMELDIRFHEIIAHASGNPLLSVLVDSFRVITRQTWNIGWRARATYENRVENIKCHERIATAVIAQDAARAEAAMSEHFDSSFMVLLKAGVS